jgi:aryl-alcohol dehydrogenase-like predicted oxidoreductase
MGLSAFYGKPKPDEERLKLLDYIYSTGLTNWDSSDLYGDSEELLGKWFARSGKRDEIFLATKFAVTTDKDGNAILRGDPEYVKEACDRSLKRLGIKTIDLYYCHRMDKVTPIEKTVQAMAELKKEGKIRYLGLSECSAQTLSRA